MTNIKFWEIYINKRTHIITVTENARYMYYLEKADYRKIHVMAHFCLKKRICTFAKEKR